MFFLPPEKNSKTIQAGEQVRRLRRGEDGKEGKEKAGSRVPELWKLLEEAANSSQEKEGGGTGGTSPQEEGENPRQRKRQTK